MFFDFLVMFELPICQYMFFSIGVLGMFLCLKRLIMGKGAF